jgi:hypothetical protein
MGAPDRGRIRPRPPVSFRRRLAVEDHAPWVVAHDRRGDLIVIRDGDVLVPGFFEKTTHELLEERFVLNE